MSDEDRPYSPRPGIRLSCREVSRLISDGLDRELPAGERARLRLHYVICDACRRTREQFRLLREGVRALERDRAGEDGVGGSSA